MAETKKWRVTINRWDIFQVKEIEAENEESAIEIALEWAVDDFHLDHIDGGLNSVQAEPEETE